MTSQTQRTLNGQDQATLSSGQAADTASSIWIKPDTWDGLGMTHAANHVAGDNFTAEYVPVDLMEEIKSERDAYKRLFDSEAKVSDQYNDERNAARAQKKELQEILTRLVGRAKQAGHDLHPEWLDDFAYARDLLDRLELAGGAPDPAPN